MIKIESYLGVMALCIDRKMRTSRGISKIWFQIGRSHDCLWETSMIF